MKNKLILDKKINYIVKSILILSMPWFTILLSNRYRPKQILLGAFVSFVIFLLLAIKKIKIKNIEKRKIIISSIIGIYIVCVLLSFADNNIVTLWEGIRIVFHVDISTIVLKIFLGILSIPSSIFIVYIFVNNIIPKIISFFKSLTTVEKKYLSIVLISSTILTTIISFNTSAFSKPIYKNKVQLYDVIYTSDTGSLVKGDAYFNVSFEENDIRQPLFGVFSLPFAVVAKVASNILFFVPNSYAFFLTIIQFLLTTISTILIGRLLKLEEKEKIYLYLLFSFSFPYIIFNLLIEQYAIGLFYLILAIYLYEENKNRINYMYIGAVGTMLTSGIIFPLITKFKNLKQWIGDIFKCFCTFVTIVIIGGQFPQVLVGMDRFRQLNESFAGKVSFSDKLYQFFNFVQSIFISAKGKYQLLNGHPSYQLITIKTISIVGIIILFLMIVSFILNRKNKMAIISFLWVLFSVFLLLIMGWGTVENGLILYTLYFSWAYLILYYLLIKKISKSNKIFGILIIATCIIMIYFNINEFINILKFAFKYYYT